MLRALPLVAAFGLAPSLSQADPLPALNLTLGETTVSGLSSGAFMAVQLQVAFSGAISGAGIVAGGPYGCADGNVYRAVRVCMNAFLGEADAGDAIEDILALSAEGAIDNPTNLAGHRLYLFHGMSDDTVDRASMNALSETYELLGVPGEQIIYETNIDAGHGFVTERGDLSCSTTDPDFLIDCDFDQAGDILNQLYPGLSDASEPREASFVTFDQSLYLNGAQGMDETGFVYIPESCAGGAPCKLHIALHGCKQGREVIGEDYARLTGYNRWAEANDIVVLYPQALKIPSSWWNWFGGNPNGCWDWWGYAGDDYLSQNAPQIAAIARMAAILGARLGP
ncbi:MAG: PHB depolymerase family esterase [Pseudomonadota bacterium]